MANSIRFSADLSMVDNRLNPHLGFSSSQDQVGSNYLAESATVTTSTTQIGIGSISTLGFLMIKNKDATNYIEVSTDNANANKVAKILPGQTCPIFCPPSSTLYWTAHTSNVAVDILAIEL